MLLAVERSSSVASAAVFDGDGRRLAGVSSATPGQGDAWPLVRGTLAQAGVSAEDVAALFLAGFSGPADPVYVHPAVVGSTTSAV